MVFLWKTNIFLCRKIKSHRFERKIGGRLFSRYYFGLLQIIQSGSSFDLFHPLIIHIQRDKLHFRPHDKNEASKSKKTLLTFKKL